MVNLAVTPTTGLFLLDNGTLLVCGYDVVPGFSGTSSVVEQFFLNDGEFVTMLSYQNSVLMIGSTMKQLLINYTDSTINQFMDNQVRYLTSFVGYQGVTLLGKYIGTA